MQHDLGNFPSGSHCVVSSHDQVKLDVSDVLLDILDSVTKEVSKKVVKRWKCDVCQVVVSDIYRHLKTHFADARSKEYQDTLRRCILSYVPKGNSKPKRMPTENKHVFCSCCNAQVDVTNKSFAAHCRDVHKYSQNSSHKAVFINRAALSKNVSRDDSVQASNSTQKTAAGKDVHRGYRKCGICNKIVSRKSIYCHLKGHKLDDDNYQDILKKSIVVNTPMKSKLFQCPVRCQKPCLAVVKDRRKHLETHKNIPKSEHKMLMHLFTSFGGNSLSETSPSTIFSRDCQLEENKENILKTRKSLQQSNQIEKDDDLGCTPLPIVTEDEGTSTITLPKHEKVQGFHISTCKPSSSTTDFRLESIDTQHAVEIVADDYLKYMMDIFSGKVKDYKNASSEAKILLRTLKNIGITGSILPLFDVDFFRPNLLKYKDEKNFECRYRKLLLVT